MKILIAVPTFETVMPETFESIYDLDSGGNKLTFECFKGYDVARARNEIAKKALEKDYGYVLMVDSDIILPKDALVNMLEEEPDICLGVYPRKNTKTGETEIFKNSSKDFFDRYKYSELSEGKMPVKGGGLGCALIKPDVFNHIAYPWFEYVCYKDFSAFSEDLYFCDCAAKVGYTIYADTRVRCGHATRGFQYE